MSKALDEYKLAYSEYIDHAVLVHNYHLAFIKHGGGDTGAGLRRSLRKMRELETKLARLSKVAYKEFQADRKELRQKRRETYERWKRENPKPKGRPKGSKTNVKHNRTDESSS